jgi:hypothetical protein
MLNGLELLPIAYICKNQTLNHNETILLLCHRYGDVCYKQP